MPCCASALHVAPLRSSAVLAWLRIPLVLASFGILLLSAHIALADIPDLHPFMDSAEVAKHEKTVTRIEHYLGGLSTVTSDFTQIAPDGSLTGGKFFMQRPGKMRWQYNPPTPVLMISDGVELVYYDYELQQVTHIPLDSTLIGFLAQENIALDGKDIGIVDFEEGHGVIRITVAQRDKASQGQLTLEFSDKPLTLRNMVVRDSTGQITTVSLNHARFGQPLDKDLFVFRDPRQGRRK